MSRGSPFFPPSTQHTAPSFLPRPHPTRLLFFPANNSPGQRRQRVVLLRRQAPLGQPEEVRGAARHRLGVQANGAARRGDRAPCTRASKVNLGWRGEDGRI
eukprot:125767-Chlamydomonas_euryale.AAC.1